jgi:predicted dehydrogenase
MKQVDRRQFLNGAGKGAVAAGFTILANAASARSYAANEKINVAQVGCGGRGRYNAYGIAEVGGRVSHLCDLHDGELESTAKFLGEIQPEKPKLVKEFRQVLEDKEVDAVVIATPDHWHSPMVVLACQAGKDAYVEKPHSHNIWESRKAIEAARKYERVVQVGTQSRSGSYNIAAREYIAAKKLGHIPLVKVYDLQKGSSFRMGESSPMPPNFDWDAWLGPAPVRPWHSRIFSSGWLQFWDFVGGGMSDDGIHQLDLAMMALGDPGMPKRVSCTGGQYSFPDTDSEIPDTQTATFEFDNFVMTYELARCLSYMEKTSTTIRRNDEHPYWTQNSTRIELYGTDTMMTLGRHGGGWQVMRAAGTVVDQMYGRPCDNEHYTNFLECIRSRQHPNADIEIGHVAQSMVHMANIAHRLGNISLEWDAQKEQFVGNKEANALLTRDYRKPYAVPKQV